VTGWLAAVFVSAAPAAAADLTVLKNGLGDGTVASAAATPGIDCGLDCDESYGSVTVTLQAVPAAGSTFVGWGGACSGTAASCTVDMSEARAVRAEFGLTSSIPPLTSFTPGAIRTYLNANPVVSTPARFVAALPAEFKQNWILMSRSESLQTGIAAMPRILLPSENANAVFTIGMAPDSSYPGAHPNAIEFMQWDAAQKNFRFHELVLDSIPDMHPLPGSPSPGFRFPARARGVAEDDQKCFACHSTRNVINRGSTPGSTGNPPGAVKFKSKPNWDSYDSWGGMMPFNRDRIYQGSVEAAAFRSLLNLWNWRGNDPARQIIEQLELQPSTVPVTGNDTITRNMDAVTDDQHIRFGFDQQTPTSSGQETVSYSFSGPATAPSSVDRGGHFARLQHTASFADEGRGVQLFDLLGGADGQINAERIADELIDHRWATGSVGIDVRPIALAVATPGCLNVSGSTITATSSTPLSIDLSFFNARNGMTIDQLITDTEKRARSLTKRKADIQRINLDRTGGMGATDDPYLLFSAPDGGLIREFGAGTGAPGDTSIQRLRQEVFQRPIDAGGGDGTVMGGIYVDRELPSNFRPVALFRYFLEPLGVSVDKWSMGVRGRSRTYTFADVLGYQTDAISNALKASLGISSMLTSAAVCDAVIPMVNSALSSLSAASDVPTYTDIQRIFNKSCIECHGGLGYPPYQNYGTSLDLTEDEAPTGSARRMTRSYTMAQSRTSPPMGTDVSNSFLIQRITANGTLTHPYDPATANETCPFGLMPCGGPPLSKADIESIRRWIIGGTPYTEGDPHMRTVDGVNYDFQSAGEFILLRDEGMEIQARQAAVTTGGPLGANAHTGLSTCVSLNTAVALRVGPHRISYQPRIRQSDNELDEGAGRQTEELILRVDGKVAEAGAEPIPLTAGGRILRTTAENGIEVQFPGGPAVVVTPRWWAHRQLWYMNINVRHGRAVEGVMGAIAPDNWLPALPDGSWLGPRPADPADRYRDLYETFADAWRVDGATSLFDYESGQTPADFVIDSWPMLAPASCDAPAQPGVPAGIPPQAPMTEAEAAELCNAVTDPNRRENCMQDVMATGEAGFAEAYLVTERLERNTMPDPPVLGQPADNSLELVQPVSFTWSTTTDRDGEKVRYRYCVWSMDELFNFNRCTPVSKPWLTKDSKLYIGLILLIALALLLLIILMKLKYRPLLMLVVLIALAPAIWLAWQWGEATELTAARAELEPGKVYFWKAVAEDDQGRVSESPTRRFATQ
jgi:hypothetical protein